VTFNLHKDHAGVPIANGQASLLKRQKSQIDRKRGFHGLTVDGITLDDFFGSHACHRAALWIDVEGACGLVLPGATDLLSRSAIVFVELEEQRFWGEGHWLHDQVIGYLWNFGFVPVARDFEYQYQYNMIMVRQELLGGATRVNAELARFASQANPTARQSRPHRGRGNTAAEGRSRTAWSTTVTTVSGSARRLRRAVTDRAPWSSRKLGS
jgi:hypothetical protein